MSQVLPAAGSVLQRSVSAPGNQPQPQVVEGGSGRSVGLRGWGRRGARGGGWVWGSGVVTAECRGGRRCGSQRPAGVGARGGSRAPRRAPLSGGPPLTHGARGVRNGDPSLVAREAERLEGAGSQARSTLPRTWDPRCPGVAILALAPLPPHRRRAWPFPGARVRRGEIQPEGAARVQALPTSTVRMGNSRPVPEGAGWGPAVGGLQPQRWWKPLGPHAVLCAVLGHIYNCVLRNLRRGCPRGWPSENFPPNCLGRSLHCYTPLPSLMPGTRCHQVALKRHTFLSLDLGFTTHTLSSLGHFA